MWARRREARRTRTGRDLSCSPLERRQRLDTRVPSSKYPDPASLLAAIPMTTISADASPAHSRTRPATLACYSCRSKHLRCDGASPVCSRCSSIGAVCTYVPSRRGRSARVRKSHASHIASPVQQHATSLPVEAASEETLVPDSAAAATASSAADTTCNPFSAAETSHLVSLYYSRFHRSHPMLVPQAHFSAQQYPDYLILAVCLVGHHFATSRPSPSLIRTAASLAESSPGVDHVHHQVQTLILCALVTSSTSKQSSHADDYIAKAVALAYASNLHCLDNPAVYEAGRGLEQESLRRTWWELYIVDAVYSLLRHRPPGFPSASLGSHPFAPCSESQFETGELSSGNIVQADFENRILMQTPPDFSSYSYRIHAAAIIRRVCTLLVGSDLDPDELMAADQAIAAWNLDSPKASFASCDTSGEVDHMLLQAHLLVQVAALFLHVPRTNLPLSAPRAMDVTCLGRGNQGTETCGLHIILSVAALKEICNLATIPWLQESHTPLLLCGFVLACAVQLAVASSRSGASSPKQIQQCRQRVVLLLSALKYMGTSWPLAQDALLRFQSIANTVFSVLATRTCDEPSRPTDNCITVEESGTGIGQQHSRVDSAYSAEPLGEDDPCNINWFDFLASVDMGDALLQRTSIP